VTWRVVIRPRAEADIQRAWQHYEDEQAGLGDELLHELHLLVQSLEHHPERAPYYYRGFRRLLASRFPYKVFYRIVGDRVFVFRVLHARQDHRQQLAD
jgi:plasmid stabilization system protein ParE